MGVPMGNMGMMPMMPMAGMMQMNQQMNQQMQANMGMNPMGAGAFSMGPSAMTAQHQAAQVQARALKPPGEAAMQAVMERSSNKLQSAKQQREWLVKELEAASEEL